MFTSLLFLGLFVITWFVWLIFSFLFFKHIGKYKICIQNTKHAIVLRLMTCENVNRFEICMFWFEMFWFFILSSLLLGKKHCFGSISSFKEIQSTYLQNTFSQNQRKNCQFHVNMTSLHYNELIFDCYQYFVTYANKLTEKCNPIQIYGSAEQTMKQPINCR